MASSETAPSIPIGHQVFQSVEHPGTIGPSSTSLAKALRTLGPPEDLDGVFNRSLLHLDLRLRPDDRWAHPIPGERSTTHRLLLKVTRRRRRQEADEGAHSNGETSASSTDGRGGVYKVDIPGSIKQTVRFRAMADYQYKPKSEARIVKLIDGLRNADYEALSTFEFAQLNETYHEPIGPVPTGQPLAVDSDDHGITDGNENTNLNFDDAILRRSLLNALPPPQFSTQQVPARFVYEHGITSRLEPYTNPIKGEEGYRYVNKQKNIIYNFRQIHHADPDTCTFVLYTFLLKPTSDIDAAMATINKDLLNVVKARFRERPMWSRLAIHNQFKEEHRRLFMAKHAYLPAHSYMIVDGPFRDNLIRLGYDPRTDPSVAIYQRIYFRNMRDDGGVRVTMNKMTDSQRATQPGGDDHSVEDGAGFKPDLLKSHTFDGKVLHRDIANYQLCDVSDPLLYKLVRDPRALNDHLDPNTGWYKPRQFYIIKAILRLKWQALKDDHFDGVQDKVDDLASQFSEYDNPSMPAGVDEELGDEPQSTPTVSTFRKRARKSRAKQILLDERGLSTNPRLYRGPLSVAAQQEQRLRSAKPLGRRAVETGSVADSLSEENSDGEEYSE